MAASGNPVTPERATVLAAELDHAEFSRAQANSAEAWILRGGPSRYGTITLADFFPTPEQLASIGYDPSHDLQAEYQRGYRAGHTAGVAEERKAWRENEEYLRLQREASASVDHDMREKLLASREAALEERLAQLAQREEAICRAERKLRIVPQRKEPAA